MRKYVDCKCYVCQTESKYSKISKKNFNNKRHLFRAHQHRKKHSKVLMHISLCNFNGSSMRQTYPDVTEGRAEVKVIEKVSGKMEV